MIFVYYIYKIENQINHKVYIGLTNNITRRRIRHFTDLRCRRHDNSFLQKEFDIYGEKNFIFNIEFEGNVDYTEISNLEKEYIKKYDSYKNGYNQNEGGNFGPSNGGSHLTQSDIYSILSALEFVSRPGQILSEIFGVSKATISRIKKGVNHNQYKEEYENMPLEERKNIYNIFNESTNFYYKKINTTVLSSKRKFSEQQVHAILFNEEHNRKYSTIENLCVIFGVASSNTIYGILKNKTYKNYYASYQNLTETQKQELVSLLRN